MATRVRTALNTTKSVTTTTQEFLAANESRKYALIVNSSDVGIWVSFGAAAVIGTGVFLAAAGGSYELDNDNLYLGAINGIAASGSGKVVGIVEFS